MAVDTPGKRFSMINFGGVPDILLIDPDGVISSGDKLNFLDLYIGITGDAPVVILPPEPVRGGYKRYRMRSEEEIRKAVMDEIGPKGIPKSIPIIVRKPTQPVKVSAEVVFSEFRKKVLNR